MTNIAKPDICVITNIGTSHIGNLGSRKNILKAKLEILEGNEKATVVINKDNDLLHKWQEENQNEKTIITYGIQEHSDMNAKEIKLNNDSSEFACELENKKVNITVPVGGEHFILNALCAVSVGKILKIEPEKIVEGIEGFELTKKRMDIAELANGIKIINDAYNASLESMQASLNYLAEFKNNRKIAVLGDMLELGEYTKELHEKVGEAVVQSQIDILFCAGEKAKYIEEQAKAKGMTKENVYWFENKEKMVEKIKEVAKANDIILLKASNGMRFFEIAEELQKGF